MLWAADQCNASLVVRNGVRAVTSGFAGHEPTGNRVPMSPDSEISNDLSERTQMHDAPKPGRTPCMYSALYSVLGAYKWSRRGVCRCCFTTIPYTVID